MKHPAVLFLAGVVTYQVDKEEAYAERSDLFYMHEIVS